MQCGTYGSAEVVERFVKERESWTLEDLNLWSRVGQSDPQLSWPTLSWTGAWMAREVPQYLLGYDPSRAISTQPRKMKTKVGLDEQGREHIVQLERGKWYVIIPGFLTFNIPPASEVLRLVHRYHFSWETRLTAPSPGHMNK